MLRRDEAEGIALEALRRQASGAEREAAVRKGAKLGELTGASAKVLGAID